MQVIFMAGLAGCSRACWGFLDSFAIACFALRNILMLPAEKFNPNRSEPGSSLPKPSWVVCGVGGERPPGFCYGQSARFVSVICVLKRVPFSGLLKKENHLSGDLLIFPQPQVEQFPLSPTQHHRSGYVQLPPHVTTISLPLSI